MEQHYGQVQRGGGGAATRHRFEIISSVMEPHMENEVRETAILAMESAQVRTDIEMCSFIRDRFDQRHDLYWICICGDSDAFACRSWNDRFKYINFRIDKKRVVLFKCPVAKGTAAAATAAAPVAATAAPNLSYKTGRKHHHHHRGGCVVS